VHRVIRATLRTLAGERGMAIPILYGGSVNRGNAAALLTAPEVDGVLVGGRVWTPTRGRRSYGASRRGPCRRSRRHLTTAPKLRDITRLRAPRRVMGVPRPVPSSPLRQRCTPSC
jgi:hypothetical protein